MSGLLERGRSADEVCNAGVRAWKLTPAVVPKTLREGVLSLAREAKKLGRSVILLATGTRPCYVMLIHLNAGRVPWWCWAEGQTPDRCIGVCGCGENRDPTQT